MASSLLSLAHSPHVGFRFAAGVLTLAALTTTAHHAHAQGPTPARVAQTAPTAEPAATTPSAHAPAATESAETVTITRGCTLGNHAGIDDTDAKTSADVICHELARKGVAGPYDVRLGKLAGRVLVTVTANDGAREERLVLNSLEELPTAATRFAHAMAEGKPIDQSEQVDAVVGTETRAPRTKPGQMGFKGGIVGAMAAGASTAPAPGVALGLLYRADRVGIDGHLRTGGGGGSPTTLGYFVVGTGAHYYFSDGDVAPYLGGGIALMSLSLKRSDDLDRSNTGLGAYAEAGVEALRTHHAGLVASLRADVPMFTLGNGPGSRYVVPTSLMLGMIFH